jgi:hypothetical protein
VVVSPAERRCKQDNEGIYKVIDDERWTLAARVNSDCRTEILVVLVF